MLQRRGVRAVSLLSFALLVSLGAFSQESTIAGVWRGNSTCTVAGSPCHDEVNVYRISAIDEKPGWFNVSADKVVDGKEVEMGTGEWRFDAKAQALIYEFSRGVFRLTLSGRHLDGTLKLLDGTLYRRIHLEKEQ